MTFPLDLYELLPAIHRREDAGLGAPLEALLDIIATEAGHLHRNITDLWDDFFIETAAEWVVPYLADLVGATPLHDVAGSRRADVANTIAYRRRKGTLSMLEDMAADVTGWGARAVAFFELVGWSQHLDHVRRQPSGHPGRSVRVGTVDVADVDALDLLDGPFDPVAHTVDVRPFGERRGRHNIRKIGFFLWRLQSYPLFGVDPRRSADHPHGYHLSPLGNAAPLFTNAEAPPGTARPEEADLPGPIRRLALHAGLETAAVADDPANRYYGPDSHHSIAVAIGPPGDHVRDGMVPAARVCVCDLSGWRRPPAGKDVAVDPLRGRITLAENLEPTTEEIVRVNFCSGFSGGVGGDLGGGPYDRRGSLSSPGLGDHHVVVSRTRPGEHEGVAWHPGLRAAVDAWLAQSEPAARAVVEVLDSATYVEEDWVLALPEGRTLEIRARSGQRPVLDGGLLEAGGAGDARLVVNGLAILGGPVRVGAGLAGLTLRHCTLVPGRGFDPEGAPASPGEPSLVSAEDTGGDVTIANAIVGPIRLPADGFTLTVADSVVDAVSTGAAVSGPAGEPGPTCDLRRVTVLGDVHVRSLGYASEVIFDGEVSSERTQTGCVRFSWVQPGARTPVRYRCQPDLALEAVAAGRARARAHARLRPRFTSRRYGQPGYAQLATSALELQTGAADGAQIGAFNRLREPQREANLRLRLEEYLPAGLEAGFIYVT